MWNHVYPINDDKEHDLETLNCKCNPKIDWDNMIVVHNAYDFRDFKEQLNRK